MVVIRQLTCHFFAETGWPLALMMEHRSSMDAKEGEKCCEEDESNNDFADPGFDPFYRQELRPIKPHFFGGLDERPVQIIRCW